MRSASLRSLVDTGSASSNRLTVASVVMPAWAAMPPSERAALRNVTCLAPSGARRTRSITASTNAASLAELTGSAVPFVPFNFS